MISQNDQKVQQGMTAGKPDTHWMGLALRMARRAYYMDEIPVGAVLVDEQGLVAVGHNLSITLNDPSAHAEMVAIRRAGRKKNNYRLVNTTLYVTLEPCPMCAGLLVHSRINRLVFGAPDYKSGAAGSVMQLCRHAQLNHQIIVCEGVLDVQCSEMLSGFFKQRRAALKAKRGASRL